MNILQTLAVFVGIPALVYGTIAVLTIAPSRMRKQPRYRPGQPWEYPAEWFAGDNPVVVPRTGSLSATGRGGARGTW